MNEKRELLRHALATIAYRGGKAVRGAPDSFATFKVHAASRTPEEILAHVGDLFDWALSLHDSVVTPESLRELQSQLHPGENPG